MKDLKLKTSSKTQKLIVNDLKDDDYVWCGHYGSRYYRSCETMAKNNPDKLELVYGDIDHPFVDDQKVTMTYLYIKKEKKNGP